MHGSWSISSTSIFTALTLSNLDRQELYLLQESIPRRFVQVANPSWRNGFRSSFTDLFNRLTAVARYRRRVLIYIPDAASAKRSFAGFIIRCRRPNKPFAFSNGRFDMAEHRAFEKRVRRLTLDRGSGDVEPQVIN